MVCSQCVVEAGVGSLGYITRLQWFGVIMLESYSGSIMGCCFLLSVGWGLGWVGGGWGYIEIRCMPFTHFNTFQYISTNYAYIYKNYMKQPIFHVLF